MSRIELLSSQDVADELDVSASTVRRAAAALGVGRTVAGRLVFDPDDVAAIADEIEGDDDGHDGDDAGDELD